MNETNGSKIHQLEEILQKLRRYIEEEKAFSKRQETEYQPVAEIEKSLVQSNPTLLLFIRSNYTIEFVNSFATNWPGYSPETLINESLLDYIHPNDVAVFKRKMDLLFQGAISSSRLAHIEFRDQNDQWTASAVEAWPHPELSHTHGIFLQIRPVDNPAAASGDLLKEQKMEALGLIAGSMAHDFRNIMAVILGATQMIEMNPPERELQKYLDMITSSVNRGNTIIKRMLTYAQTPEPSIVQVEINGFIQKFCKKYRTFIPDNISIKFEEFSEEAAVLADPDHLKEVLEAVCENAIDAMPEGGALRVSVGEPLPARSRAGGKEGFLTITIQDNGRGMSKEVLSKIFNPFFSTKDTGDAVGLSLPMSHNLIQHMDGWIEVQSEEGIGTKVTIGIPRIGKSREKTSAPHAEPAERGKAKDGFHILVVEDEAHLRELLAELLKAKGYEVSVAANGRDGFNIFQGYAQEIDLIVTDLKMPTLSGYELEKKIHAQFPGQKIVAITGSIHSVHEDRDALSGFDAVIEKPFDVPEILNIVSKVLERSRVL